MAWLVKNHRWDFDTLVIDELSSFKSSKAQRFRALKKVRPLCRRVIGLTGTPAPNTLIDLWPQIYLLDMGKRLGRFVTHFREQYFLPDKRSAQQVFTYKPRPGAEAEIYRRIGDICVSMKAADHLRMPELVSSRVEVCLSAKEQKLYDTLKRELVLKLDSGEVDAANAAALSGKLLQLAGGAVYGEDKQVLRFHERKLDALEDLIEAANGKPLLVAYWYRHDLERIRERFDARPIATARDIADWNAGKIAVGLIHPASAGHGLNLQEGGSTLIWFTPTWSLELYQQTNARLWRQGQRSRTVVVRHIIARGTHDEDVMRGAGAQGHGTGRADPRGQGADRRCKMSGRVEKLLKAYPEMIQKRDCIAYQLAHFKGLSAEDVIDSMMTPRVDGERVRSSRLSDKTAQIALEYRDRQARFNREWYEWLEKQWQLLNDEIRVPRVSDPCFAGKILGRDP